MIAVMYDEAKAHFKLRDPLLYAAALEIDLPELPVSHDLFRDIVWTIVGQQLSSRAADSIFARLQTLFHEGLITPPALLARTHDELRGVGLSGAKARAVQAFAGAVAEGRIDLARLPRLADAEVREVLTQVKGIGPWTAEMVLMFSLGRPDIFSSGDLGLRKGMMELYNMKKPPSERRLNALQRAWSPYRTYAARVLWKLSDRKTNRVGRKRAA